MLVTAVVPPRPNRSLMLLSVALILPRLAGAFIPLGSQIAAPTPQEGKLSSGPVNASAASLKSIEAAQSAAFFDRLREDFGLTYFTFFYGPGVIPGQFRINPNHLGYPENDGVSAQNQVSLRWKFSKTLALDLQLSFRLIFNNGIDSAQFQHFRWEAPRLGVSGRLLSGDHWALTGAINTDFPGFLPEPLSGYKAQQRKVLFNPGMFASFKYMPRRSRWSIFTVLSPRYFFYGDKHAAEPQQSTAGFVPQNKPELIIAFLPTLSYSLSDVIKLTLGSNVDYRKQVISGWNPLRASLASNGSDPGWRLSPVPVNFGVSFTLSEALNIFPFVSCYPIAIQRVDNQTNRQASFLQATSLGMWINGSLF